MTKSLTIDEFCEVEKISRAQWYVLKKRGEVPTAYKIGARQWRISLDAYREWRTAREGVAA